jgi:hypothetical protein
MLDKIIVFDEHNTVLEVWNNHSGLTGLITAGHVLINMHEGDPYSIFSNQDGYEDYTVVSSRMVRDMSADTREKHILVKRDKPTVTSGDAPHQIEAFKTEEFTDGWGNQVMQYTPMNKNILAEW